MQSSKFLEGVGSKLAEQWFATVLTPAFVFWAGGLTTWVQRFGWKPLQEWFNQQSEPLQIALLVSTLLIVATSAVIIQRFEYSVLRALEGYWPRWSRWLQWPFVYWQKIRLDRMEKRWQALRQEDFPHLKPYEKDDFVRLDVQLTRMPAQPDQLMPTQLGNRLRAAELRSYKRYGLDAVICWPRLWSLLPDNLRADLQAARADLNTAARVWLWSILFILWSPLAWWALPAGIIAALFTYYGWILNAAELYSDLFETAFDLHRAKLYIAARWPLPKTVAEEQHSGHQLTQYFWHGLIDDQFIFINSSGDSKDS